MEHAINDMDWEREHREVRAMTLASTRYSRARDNAYRKQRDARAFERRLREEQAEARALGVEVVEKDFRIDNRWSDDEIRVLKILYPDYVRIQARLPHRSIQAIQTKARDIGISKSQNLWTAAEYARLKKLWPVATIEEIRTVFPQYTSNQLSNAATYLRLRRPKKALKPTGNSLCDAIRNRARALNMTMIDLDKISGTGDYFITYGWKVESGHSYSKMVRAIHALGGTVTVDWGSDTG